MKQEKEVSGATANQAACEGASIAACAAAAEDKRVFTNVDCPYFPCHTLLANETFNCAFCYCPLYALGPECGGAFRYNEKGYKDCTYCTVMHEGARGFSRVQELFPKLAELARRK